MNMKKTGKRIIALLISLLMMTAVKPSRTMAEGPVEISDAAQLQEIVSALNADGGAETVVLTQDVSLASGGRLNLTSGELTILGGGHALNAAVALQGTAVLNLGSSGYGETLSLNSSRSDLGVVNIDGTAVINIYDGVTIGPCSRIGTAGGITANGQSRINMYGGTITGCSSASVAGGVYLNGNSVFNLSGGTIKDCTGVLGGAVGLSGGSPLGGSAVSSVQFNMSGGLIENCTDQYIGGGAVCAWTAYPIVFNLSGGEIRNCRATSYGYGGGICLYTTADTVFQMTGGTITGCSSTESKNAYGGGIFVYAKGSSDIRLAGGAITGNSAKVGGGMMIFTGNVSIADGFGLHNNSASAAADDIYSNGTNVTLGTVDTNAVLQSCGHSLTGWYKDNESRWNYSECTGQEDHLELFTDTGTLYTGEYGLKAAHGILAYTVTWVNDDGSVLETDTEVPLGSMPEYNGDTPVKAADAQYTYTFAEWSPEVSAVTGDVTYTAVYSKTLNTYTVTWKDDDGSVLETDENVPYGSMPEYNGDTPAKAADAQYTYTFEGWSPEVSAVTGDVSYTAVYSKILNTYTVTWQDADGSVLESDTEVPYGSMPEYNGDTPAKAADAQYTYTFENWTPEAAAVTGDATYTAVYSKTLNTYTVTWRDDDGSVLETDENVPYGTAAAPRSKLRMTSTHTHLPAGILTVNRMILPPR